MKFARTAAWLNLAVGLANLVVVFGMLGPTLLADQNLVVQRIVSDPLPLYLLEMLKGLSALVIVGLVWGLQLYLPAMRWPSLNLLLGGLSAALWVASGVVGANAIATANNLASSAGGAPNAPVETYHNIAQLVNGLGTAGLGLNGLWLLRSHWHLLQVGGWPRGLAYLGLVLGGLSLLAWVLPPLALLVLLASLVWSVWLGWHLGKAK